MIRGDYLKVIGGAEPFLEMASVFPNLLAIIHTQIYLAAAYEKINRRDEAMMALKVALELAMPDQLYIPFVENGDYIYPLLENFSKDEIYTEGIQSIFNIYVGYEKSVQKMNCDYGVKEKIKLTQREREIAILASEGLTNKEISERLYISQNTIKTQLKAIFEKLEINSRALLKQVL